MRDKLILTAMLAAGLSLFGPGPVEAFGEKQADVLNIPPDTPERFLDRYRHFIPGKESKPIKKIAKRLEKLAKKPQTEEVRAETERLTAERDALITAFWAARDTDPATPENEFKQLVDERIADIADEWFFSNTDIPGLLFRSNGGFLGDMSRVFQLHGPPHVMGSVEGMRFVNLMLWIYPDPDNGRIRYAFLFYVRSGSGGYDLFPQDQYKMDICGAINEISQFKAFGYMPGMGCTADLQLTYQELSRAVPRTGNLGPYIFIWALQNVSEDPSEFQGTALQPPEAAAVSARKSGARVVGEAPELTGTPDMDYILSSCDECRSLIPAELRLARELTITVRRKDVDWRLVGDAATCELKARVVFEHVDDPKLVIISDFPDATRGYLTLTASRTDITERGDENVLIPVLGPEAIAALKPGWYRVSVYLKNTLTNKYAAWNVRYVKND